MKHLFKDDGIDRSNTVRGPDGHVQWVAPGSLERHGLKNGQKVSKAQWNGLCWTLAREWVDYTSQFKCKE